MKKLKLTTAALLLACGANASEDYGNLNKMSKSSSQDVKVNEKILTQQPHDILSAINNYWG